MCLKRVSQKILKCARVKTRAFVPLGSRSMHASFGVLLHRRRPDRRAEDGGGGGCENLVFVPKVGWWNDEINCWFYLTAKTFSEWSCPRRKAFVFSERVPVCCNVKCVDMHVSHFAFTCYFRNELHRRLAKNIIVITQASSKIFKKLFVLGL